MVLIKSIVGREYENKYGHKFIVLSQIKYQRLIIKFFKTGFEREACYSQILEGTATDDLEPSVYGIGITGYAKWINHKIAYGKWKNMISRCYNIADKQYKRYGEKGVTVCDRWLRFDYFLEDLFILDGYDRELFNDGLLQLDKDIKQFKKENKVYSKDTCCLVSAKNNSKYRVYSIQKEFIAISPEGSIFNSMGIKEFCRDHGLTAPNVSRCLRGLDKQHKGWKFKYIEIEVGKIV